jgi:secreted trypsin-like serine protease
MLNVSRKFLIAAIGLTLAATSLHASAQQRIVGGSFVPNGSYPWTAALLTSSGSQFCGGSLIASKWVLTAAHCSASAASVRVGSVDRTSGGQVIRVVRKINHPNYNGQNDIALLELASPVSGITPIARGTSTPAVGSSIRLLGWGQTTSPFGGDSGSRYLKLLDTTVLTRGTCNNNPGPGDLCIKGTRTATACKGDSGGPALVGGRLVGATSRSGRVFAGLNYCGEDVIYTNVTYYNTWINNTAR